MKNQNPFTYYEQHFTPEIRVFYYVLIEGKETPLQIEFTDEVVRHDEEMMGYDCFECWDEQENRYVYYNDKLGNHFMKTKNVDEDIIEFTVETIYKKEKY
jgi:hypothetical protein